MCMREISSESMYLSFLHLDLKVSLTMEKLYGREEVQSSERPREFLNSQRVPRSWRKGGGGDCCCHIGRGGGGMLDLRPETPQICSRKHEGPATRTGRPYLSAVVGVSRGRWDAAADASEGRTAVEDVRTGYGRRMGVADACGRDENGR